MYIVYEPGDIVKLRRTYEYDDLDDWGLEEDELVALREADDVGYSAKIVAEVADGYYDIVVYDPYGTQRRFNAICSYHLRPDATDYKLLLDVEGI